MFFRAFHIFLYVYPRYKVRPPNKQNVSPGSPSPSPTAILQRFCFAALGASIILLWFDDAAWYYLALDHQEFGSSRSGIGSCAGETVPLADTLRALWGMLGSTLSPRKRDQKIIKHCPVIYHDLSESTPKFTQWPKWHDHARIAGTQQQLANAAANAAAENRQVCTLKTILWVRKWIPNMKFLCAYKNPTRIYKNTLEWYCHEPAGWSTSNNAKLSLNRLEVRWGFQPTPNVFSVSWGTKFCQIFHSIIPFRQISIWFSHMFHNQRSFSCCTLGDSKWGKLGRRVNQLLQTQQKYVEMFEIDVLLSGGAKTPGISREVPPERAPPMI